MKELNMKLNFYILLFIFFIYNNIIAKDDKYQLNQIHQWSDVLNIEGGTIAKKLSANQKWFNVATVLDRPYLDGIEFEYMAKNKKFDLKESDITQYNELQNLFVHITLLKYCIDNAHKISNKKNNECVKIVVQVHRPKSGIKYISILDDILKKTFVEFSTYKKIEGKLANELFGYELPNNVSINFRYGSEAHTLIGYENADIVISISLVAGFNPNFKSGDIVVPTNFVPMDLNTMTLFLKEQYYVKNYFFEELENIIRSQKKETLDVINNNFNSPNKDKFKLKAQEFTKKDFNEVTVLHVNKNFTPSLLPQEFVVKN